MKFWLGLAIGLVLGAAGTYLVVAPPWHSGSASKAASAGATAPPDAGVGSAAKKGGKRRGGVRHGGGGGGGGAANSGSGDHGEAYDVDDAIELTAADRTLEWRGDSVSLAPRTLDLSGNATDGRPLDDGEMQRGIAAGSGRMIDCIKDAVGGAPLAAEVTLQMLVSGDGDVQKLRVRAPAYLQAHGLLACARRAARSFSFAATGAPTIVTTPYQLNQ